MLLILRTILVGRTPVMDVVAHFLLENSLSRADNIRNTTATLSAFGYRATLAVFLWAYGK